MRNKRGKWTFFKSPTRRILSSKEAQYWKHTLKKILKVGMEFEFNLPDKNGDCNGDLNTCPCRRYHEGCWLECTNSICKETPSYNTCANKGEMCKPELCSECVSFEHDENKCSLHCTGFVPKCLVCENYTPTCEGCVHLYDPNMNSSAIRKHITNALSPTNNYGHIGKGIHSIKKDGSLTGDGGAEIITNGRRPYYWELYNMTKEIIDTSVAKGAFMNERSSIHMHLLAAYYGNLGQLDKNNSTTITELEKNIPEVVVSNFHQLCRRYQNAMTWMFMGLNEEHQLTRWEKFRISIFDISAIKHRMPTVREAVALRSSDRAGRDKYGWVNYKYLGFDVKGDISKFHVEMRALDGILSPSIVSAVGCMYYALMIKAVEMSRYGILNIGTDDWIKSSKVIKKSLLNNTGSYGGTRYSDTSQLMQHRSVLVSEATELVNLLKHILIETGPAYDILLNLAKKPAALYRMSGKTWNEIEDIFKIETTERTDLENAVDEYIDMQLIDDCTTIEEWIEEVIKSIEAEHAFNDAAINIKNYINKIRNKGGLVWSEQIGTPIRT